MDDSNCSNGDVRLVNGRNILEGRVEICINRVWGTVCSEAFTIDEAKVTCRSLGMIAGDLLLVNIMFQTLLESVCPYTDSESAVARVNAAFGEGTGPIFLSLLDCEGSEKGLLDCNKKAGGIGIARCSHSEDAGVVCPGTYFTYVCISKQHLRFCCCFQIVMSVLTIHVT